MKASVFGSEPLDPPQTNPRTGVVKATYARPWRAVLSHGSASHSHPPSRWAALTTVCRASVLSAGAAQSAVVALSVWAMALTLASDGPQAILAVLAAIVRIAWSRTFAPIAGRRLWSSGSQ